MGCGVSPVACQLTWGVLHLREDEGPGPKTLEEEQRAPLRRVHAEIDQLAVETDGKGWQAKVFLYCVEARCPQTGWMVPLLPTRMVSKGYHTIVELIPDAPHKRYDIVLRSGLTKAELAAAAKGTVRTDGRGQDPYLIHTVDGNEYRTKISSLRGDYRKDDGVIGNRLRLWEK